MSHSTCESEDNSFELQKDEVVREVRTNWLTRKPSPHSTFVTEFSVGLLVVTSFLFWLDIFQAGSWMTAIPQNVFGHHEYWRLWTAVFAHGDPEHLLSNSLLFAAFAYLLYGHFGKWLFPIAALFFGGVINLIVLTTLAPDTHLLGASGVVYWMGAVWLTLYFCIENRDKISRRLLKALGVGAVLFIPEKFHPEISYLSHFVGFMLGIAWGLLYYLWNRKKFLAHRMLSSNERTCRGPQIL
jgi:membrane associated rhomboid family serine protease